ncbi:hypothetical protein BJX96DRAFT_6418 [Aspergillus floccosus]
MSFLTRIPAAPLITLVVVNLLYVVRGFVFAAIALITTRHEVPEIQARLNCCGPRGGPVQKGRVGSSVCAREV